MSFVEDVTVTTSLVDDVAVASQVVETTVATTAVIGEGAGGSSSVQMVAGDGTLTVFGQPGRWGTAKASPVTSTGERLRLVDVASMAWSPGMGPFFSTILPDGTVAMPQLQLAVNQVTNTGTTMSMGFFHPDQGFYSVTVPTNQGATETFAVNRISGVIDDAGGADLSDTVLVYDGATPVLFGLSAFPYRGWRVSTFGVYPVFPAFILNATTGRWEYNDARSVYASTLRASHANGPDVWPNAVNFYGETVTETRLPAEMAVLPRSGHVAVSIYAPRTGRQWGSIAAIDLLAKAQRAWYEWPDMLNGYGWGTRAFTRDINTDPTSVANDERIVVNLDVFEQPNETWNVTVWADSGTFTLSWGASTSAGMPVGVRAEDMRAVLEAMPSIGAGNVAVREARPFLVQTYVVYEIEMIGTLAHTNLSATVASVATGSLVNNGGTAVSRWRTGGTGYTAQSNFPFVELAYNAGAATIVPKTVPMYAHHGTEDPVRGEKPDGSAGMTWYTAAGDLVVAVGGHNSNPQMFTSFRTHGIQVFRAAGVGVDRAYVALSTPTVGWESRLGEARPAPDFTTTPIHADSNALVLGLAEDTASGSLIVPAASGVQLLCEPHGRWLPRSGPIVRPSTFTGAGDIAGWTAGGGAVAYDAGEQAMRWTASGSADGVLHTATGTGGIPLDAEMVGEVLHFEVTAKAAAVRRLVRLACRFWSSGGGEVGSLTGYGQSNAYDTTGTYRRIVGAAKVPAGAAFLSFQIEYLDPGGSGEIHYIKSVIVRLSAYWPTPAKLNAGTVPLYTGQAGGSWMAKGFVDAETRMLWLPYLQVMSAATAKNTRYPAWLVRLNCADLFPTREVWGRVKTAAAWSRQNVVLERGETGQESDTRKTKVGDGVTDWVTLGYSTV